MHRLPVAERPSLHSGDYVCSTTDLYCVEEIVGGRVLLENCMTGELIEMRLSGLLHMERVEPNGQATARSGSSTAAA